MMQRKEAIENNNPKEQPFYRNKSNLKTSILSHPILTTDTYGKYPGLQRSQSNYQKFTHN